MPAANVPGFLAAMAERRRIRRRDGAREWSLLRDLSDPELWIERFHVATWLDYVRHNRRRTRADEHGNGGDRKDDDGSATGDGCTHGNHHHASGGSSGPDQPRRPCPDP